MTHQKYTPKPETIQTVLNWIEDGQIDIPDIQRPFVWKPVQVSSLLDSLYRGYPIGYLITWLTAPTHTPSGAVTTQRLLIDGQQRVVALRAAILGQPVLSKGYKEDYICIEFNPTMEQFRVRDTRRSPEPGWVPDISKLFQVETALGTVAKDYVSSNPDSDYEQVLAALKQIRGISHLHIGNIELIAPLHISVVTDIFTRINSQGVTLGEPDFAMSKMASLVEYDGALVRKTIDYFCRLLRQPLYLKQLPNEDSDFAESSYFGKLTWLSQYRGSLYSPEYKDLLRVAFCSSFNRAKMSELSLLLSGRNFEERRDHEKYAEEAFSRLRDGIFNFIKPSHYRDFSSIVQSAGFTTSKYIRSRHAINFAYVLYLRGRKDKQLTKSGQLGSLVRKWLVMSLLTSRYSGPFETTMETDIRGIEDHGFVEYCTSVMREDKLTENFWTEQLPRSLRTARQNSLYTPLMWVAQMFNNDEAFLVKTIPVSSALTQNKSIHHIYPVDHLSGKAPDADPNRLANLVATTPDVNTDISNTSPQCYFPAVVAQCAPGKDGKYGDITDIGELAANFRQNCIPECILHGDVPEYPEFLRLRAKLIADRMRLYFDAL